jgi:hypothetical protein
MRNSLVLLALLGFVLLSGCCAIPGMGGGETNQTQLGEEVEIEVEPFSAHTGLAEAREAIRTYAPDAVLITVYGVAESDGKSVQWEYTFDSMQNRKSYTVTIPGKAVRERPYAFMDTLGEDWMDSTDASSQCHTPGEYSLELAEGSPVWTVSFERNVCEASSASQR